MNIIDISRKLAAGTAVWPGDTPYDLQRVLNISDGQAVNLTTLTLSAHTGSHVDAPLHFDDTGQSIDGLDLLPYWGMAQVFTVAKTAGPLVAEDFIGCDFYRAPRLLVRSVASDEDQAIFPAEFVYPSPELVAQLAATGIILYGSDAPSMDDQNSKDLPGHHALWRHGISILEWLDLGGVADGLYELVALPLRIAGGDGSPVRAALRPM